MTTTNDTQQMPPMASASTTETEITPGSFSHIISPITTNVVAYSEEGSQVSVLDTSTLDSILTRPRLISTITIVGTELWNVNILGTSFDPYALFVADPLIASLMAPFSAFRGDMSVSVVIKCPGSCMGAIVFSALCDGGQLPSSSFEFMDGPSLDSVFSAFSDTFGVISYANVNDLVFDLPFVSQRDYWDYRSGGSPNCWRLQAYPLTPLQSMISTTAVATIKIYANFKPGFRLCNAYFQGKQNIDGLSGFKKRVKELKSNAQQRVLSATGGHKISDLTSTAASITASIAGFIPAIAPMAAPIAAGLASISSVASWLGFTRESLVYYPEPTVSRMMSSYSGVDGIDTSERLIMCSDAVLSIDPSLSGGSRDDLLSFASLRKRWALVSTFDLTTSTPVGKIFELPVTPSLGGVYLGVIFLSAGGYYGLPFAFWRGGMEYLIYIPSSTMMRGGLQILWSPAVTPSSTLPAYSSDPTNRLNNVVLDLNDTQQHIIKVPYSSTQMLMENDVIAENKYSNRSFQNCNGSLTFYLTSPFVAPRTGLISTKVHILARPAEDMVFAEPRWTINDCPLTAAIRLQSGDLDPIDEYSQVFETTILSAPISAPFDVARLLTSEVAPSARALMQKFTEISVSRSPNFHMTALVPLNGGQTTHTWHVPSIARDSGVRGVWTWGNHYSAMFTGVRGSVRVKLTQVQPYCNTNVLTVTGAHDQSPQIPIYATQCNVTPEDIRAVDATQSSYSGDEFFMSRPMHNLVQTLSTTQACEFSFPYSSELKYQNPRSLRVGFVPSAEILVRGEKALVFRGDFSNLLSNPTLSDFVTMRVATAFGDDVSVTRFRRVPGLVAAYLCPAT